MELETHPKEVWHLMKIQDLQNLITEAQDKPGPRFYALPPDGGGGGGNQGGGGIPGIRNIQPPQGPGLPNWWEITGNFGDLLSDIFGASVIDLINDAVYGINYPVDPYPGFENNQNLAWQVYNFVDHLGQPQQGWGFAGGDGTIYIPVNLPGHGFGWWPAQESGGGNIYVLDPTHQNYPDNWDAPSWNGPDLLPGAESVDPVTGLPDWVMDPEGNNVDIMDLVNQGYLPNWIGEIQADLPMMNIGFDWSSAPDGGPAVLVVTGNGAPLGAANLVWSTAAGRWIVRDSPGSMNYWDVSSPAIALEFTDPETGKRATYGIDKNDYGDGGDSYGGDSSGGGNPDGSGGQGGNPDTDPDGDGPKYGDLDDLDTDTDVDFSIRKLIDDLLKWRPDIF
jgi:hypothetical protein